MGSTVAKKNIGRFLTIIIAFIIMSLLTPAVLAAGLPDSLIPMGKTVGINISCDGIMVVSLNEVNTAEGAVKPATDAGLVPGDIITHINADEIDTLDDFKTAIAKKPTETMTVRIKRDGQEMQFNLTPAINNDGAPELGLWLRDKMAGIGTVTFYDPESGTYGALGHSVSDAQAGSVIALKSGTITPAKIMSIAKGEAGHPGELKGDFDFNSNIGTINKNTEAGIFGTLEEPAIAEGKEAIPVGGERDIELGEAKIMANIDGEEVREFSIEISRIFSGGDNRKVMITVTDEELLKTTGGIVQGMSGSPIIQNDKLVGAVTHVLINNPEKGYGISMDSMLSAAFEKDKKAA